jgi:hypothetical protein
MRTMNAPSLTRSRESWALLAAALLASGAGGTACGKTTSPVATSPDASMSDASGASTVADASFGDSGVRDADSAADSAYCAPAPFPCGSHPCPDSLPEAGAACEVNSVACRYDDPATAGCVDRATCVGNPEAGVWTVTMAEAGTSCATPQPSACPPTYVAALAQVGQACSDVIACLYPQGTCGCPVEEPDAQVYTWTCIAPAADSGCPAEIPDAGTACTPPQHCSYGAICGPLAREGLVCDCCGQWMGAGFAPCPPYP